MSSPSQDHCIDDTLLKLQSLEVTMTALFGCSQSDNDTALLANTLNEAMNLVAKLPLNLNEDDERSKLCADWRAKPSFWMKLYLGGFSYSENMSSPVAASSMTTFMPTPPRTPCACSQYLDQDDSHASEDSFETCKEATNDDVIRAKLSKIFYKAHDKANVITKHKLALPNVTLLYRIVDAFKMVPPTLKNPEIQSWAFELAFGRLSTHFRDHFETLYAEEDYCLYSLFNFIRFELGTWVSGNHPSKQFVKNTLCFRCFTYGHSINQCQGEPLFLWPQQPLIDPKYAQLSLLFTRVSSVKSNRDFPGFDRLLVAIVSAFELVPPNEQYLNGPLHLHAFVMAFRKLPEQLRLLFASQYTFKDYCLYSLFNFINLEMKEFVANFPFFYSKFHLLDFVIGRRQVKVKDAYGAYNRTQGSLCYRCFRSGHVAQHCKKEHIFHWKSL